MALSDTELQSILDKLTLEEQKKLLEQLGRIPPQPQPQPRPQPTDSKVYCCIHVL